MKKKYLLAPGPIPVPEEVSLAIALPPRQRTSQCGDIFGKVTVGDIF
jgi:aspartate aminotransferase-like enzyme